MRELVAGTLAIVVVLVLVGGSILGLELYWAVSRTTEGDIERLIENNLPPGSTTDQIFAFLDSRGIDHDQIKRFDPDLECCALQDAGVPPGTLIIGAILHDTTKSLFVSGDIVITFILREDGWLSTYLVEEVYTGF